MSELERRQTRGAVELRAAGGERRIGGYAAKFNTLSQNLGGFVESIAPGFFDTSRDKAWAGVMARYNHDALLGTTSAESLRLNVDGTGLDYEVDLLTDVVSERVLQLVSRGDVHQSSFAFYVTEDEWSLTDQGFPMRTLLRGELVDVAPVDNPAYLDTSTGLRSLAEHRGIEIAEVEQLARTNELARLLDPKSKVIDLGSTDSGEEGRGDTRGPSGRLQVLRRALEMKKAV